MLPSFIWVDRNSIATYNSHFDRVYQLYYSKARKMMSVLQAEVRTTDGATVFVKGFPQGQIAKGTTEETVIAYAMTGGWKLTKVSALQDQRVLEFVHTGQEDCANAQVLIANYENGSLTNLWSTEDKYLNRTRFLGERSHEAPIFLAREGWKLLTALEGRAYYVRLPKKAVKIQVSDQYWSEMYV